MAKISDIKVLGPDDKLVILFKDKAPPPHQVEIAVEAVKRLSEGKNRALLVGNCDVYIIKKGAKVLLKDELNKELVEDK